jgi:hypothetical protein
MPGAAAAVKHERLAGGRDVYARNSGNGQRLCRDTGRNGYVDKQVRKSIYTGKKRAADCG